MLSKSKQIPDILEAQSARIFNSVDWEEGQAITSIACQRISRPRTNRQTSMEPMSPEKDYHSYTETDADSSDFLDEEMDDFDSDFDMKNLSTVALTIRVVNSTFIFGSLMLPYYMFTSGLLLGILLFVLFFAISYMQSSLLMEVRLEAKRKIYTHALSQIFLSLGSTTRTITIFRVLFILNHLLYLVLCFTIFGLAMQLMVGLFFPEPYHANISRRLFVLAGGLVVLPFLLKEKYPVYMVAAARALGWFAIVLIVLTAIIVQPPTFETKLLYPPTDFSFSALFSAMPSVLLAFAYHQAFFTTQVDLDPNNAQAAALIGSIVILCVELVVASTGSLAFTNEFSLFNDNLVDLVEEKNHIPLTVKGIFLLLISASALIQVLQYIPQSVRQIQNVINGPKPQQTPQQKEFQMVHDKMSTLHLSFTISSPKKQDSSPPQVPRKSQPIPWIALGHTTLAVLLALLLPPIVLPILLMGSITQNSLSLLLPSILYLKWEQANGGLSGVKCFVAGINLIVSLLFGFLCLLSGILQLKQYYQQ